MIDKNPKTFHRLFGIPPQEFEIILKIKKVELRWHEKVISGDKRPGRRYKVDLSDMLLMLLLYDCRYVTHVFVGYMFGIDDSRVCAIIHRLEPIPESWSSKSPHNCQRKSSKEAL
jgi:hypothetical protein